MNLLESLILIVNMHSIIWREILSKYIPDSVRQHSTLIYGCVIKDNLVIIYVPQGWWVKLTTNNNTEGTNTILYNKLNHILTNVSIIQVTSWKITIEMKFECPRKTLLFHSKLTNSLMMTINRLTIGITILPNIPSLGMTSA